MMSNCLDLNNTKIKQGVVSKLRILGYKVNDNTKNWEIEQIIRVIQRNNGLMMDGLIGIKTAPFLGYNDEEIRKMLKMSKYKISKHTNHSSYIYPFWFFVA